jgi:hypothetical protein
MRKRYKTDLKRKELMRKEYSRNTATSYNQSLLLVMTFNVKDFFGHFFQTFAGIVF